MYYEFSRTHPIARGLSHGLALSRGRRRACGSFRSSIRSLGRPALDKYHQGYQRYARAHDEEIARTQAETQTIPKQHRPLPVPESMANPSAIILVAQMPRLRKIDSCPPKKFSSYLILPVPFRDRPPVPTRRAPRRIAKRQIDKGRSPETRAAFSHNPPDGLSRFRKICGCIGLRCGDISVRP